MDRLQAILEKIRFPAGAISLLGGGTYLLILFIDYFIIFYIK